MEKVVVHIVGIVLALLIQVSAAHPQDSTETHIRKKFEIRDGISPKSVVSSGTGIFAAQNMMYRHTITFYDKRGNRLAKVKDGVNLKKFGFSSYENQTYLGAPVEAEFTKDGKYLWVSNYHMKGPGFENPGCDPCVGKGYDPGFIYKISTDSFTVETVIKVGSVPKFLAISPDETKLLVSNWTSSDVSVIDLQTETEIKRINVGAHPRGIAISSRSDKAYIAVMGGNKVLEMNLSTFETTDLNISGKSPRSLLLSPDENYLYISMNTSATIIRYHLTTGESKSVATPRGPRSMTLSQDGNYLYTVHYFANTFTRIETDSMSISAEIQTKDKPIGICGNWEDSEIWVACYSGTIEVFKDFQLQNNHPKEDFLSQTMTWFAQLSSPAIDSLTNIDSIPLQENTVVQDSNKTVREELISDSETTTSPTAEPNSYTPRQPTPLQLSKKRPEVTPPSDCTYHIIVGAFGVYENAEKKCEQLRNDNYTPQLIEGKLNYVSAVCCRSEIEAEAAKKKIQTELPGASSAWILKVN